MHQIVNMQRVDCIAKLLNNIRDQCNLYFLPSPEVLFHQSIKVSIIRVLAYQVNMVVIIEEPIDSDDILVMKVMVDFKFSC